MATSWDSKEFYQKYRPQSLFERERDLIIEASLPSEESVADLHITENTDVIREIGK